MKFLKCEVSVLVPETCIVLNTEQILRGKDA